LFDRDKIRFTFNVTDSRVSGELLNEERAGTADLARCTIIFIHRTVWQYCAVHTRYIHSTGLYNKQQKICT